MYNGNGNSYGSGPSRRGAGIPPLYLYIGVGILVLLGIWLLLSFFRAGIDGYFALLAGVLLVLGNLRDLIANPYAQRGNVSLLNTLIGGGLIFFFLGKGNFPPIGGIWYVPAIILMLIAAPLMLGRAAVYTAYVGTARRAIGTVRQAIGSRIKTY
jgi:hypothetical protein